MVLTEILLVGVGGFLGSIARYLAHLFVKAYVASTFPLSTLLVNICGCFVIGVLAGVAEKIQPTPSRTLLFLGVGVLGGFTTFSSFGLETVNLLRGQEFGFALINILASVGAGLGAVWIGRTLVL